MGAWERLRDHVGINIKLLLVILVLSILPLVLVWYQISAQLERMQVFVVKDAQKFAMTLEKARGDKSPEDVAAEYAAAVGREIESANINLLTTMLVLIVSISLLLLVLARFFARYLSRPLEKLEGAIREWDGRTPIHVFAEGGGEIAELARQFSYMTDKVARFQREAEERRIALERADKELMEFNLTLEKQIDKRTRKLQEALEKVEGLERTKDEFLSLITHELKTPLTSISACAEALAGDVDLPESTVMKFMGIIQDETTRLARLINEVLEFSRITAGKLPFLFKRIDLIDLLDRAVLQNRPTAQKSALTLRFVPPEKIDSRLRQVRADPDRIQQVLTNLLGNALKFTPKGNSVTVKLDVLRKSVGGRKTDFAQVQVKDTGIGIDPSERAKVFERFAQAGAMEHHSEGTGLGMPIARGIIREHGGKIWFASHLGKGTTFYFTLPL